MTLLNRSKLKYFLTTNFYYLNMLKYFMYKFMYTRNDFNVQINLNLFLLIFISKIKRNINPQLLLYSHYYVSRAAVELLDPQNMPIC